MRAWMARSDMNRNIDPYGDVAQPAIMMSAARAAAAA